MVKFGKIVGAALGWAFGGPIGGIIGLALGSIFDDDSLKMQTTTQGGRGYDSYRHHTSPADFSAALLVLSAAVMKADGKVLKSEIGYVRNFLAKQFGEASAQQQILALRDILEKEIPLKDVCEQIRHFMEHPMRLQLLHYLFGIAKADGKVEEIEVEVVERIARYLGINSRDMESIRAMFYNDPGKAYTILEIEQGASDEEIKKAYRKMAMKYHPDKVRELGEQHEKAAHEKFIEVQKAYDTLKKEKGF